MSELGTWQVPAADDISPDALEYFFRPKYRPQEEPPWVKVCFEPEDSANNAVPEPARLSATIDILSHRLQTMSVQLQSATYEIGYLRGRLAEKEQELKQMSEFRVKAGQANFSQIALKVEQERNKALKAELALLKRSWFEKMQDNIKPARATVEAGKPIYVPVLPWVMLLTFWFTCAFTMTSLKEGWWF